LGDETLEYDKKHSFLMEVETKKPDYAKRNPSAPSFIA
jgi:hypothetical protein